MARVSRPNKRLLRRFKNLEKLQLMNELRHYGPCDRTCHRRRNLSRDKSTTLRKEFKRGRRRASARKRRRPIMSVETILCDPIRTNSAMVFLSWLLSVRHHIAGSAAARVQSQPPMADRSGLWNQATGKVHSSISAMLRSALAELRRRSACDAMACIKRMKRGCSRTESFEAGLSTSTHTSYSLARCTFGCPPPPPRRRFSGKAYYPRSQTGVPVCAWKFYINFGKAKSISIEIWSYEMGYQGYGVKVNLYITPNIVVFNQRVTSRKP